jgi:alpha-1,3-glucosyltransferase
MRSGHFINPTWVALDKSRGIETPESKLFMRMTVLVLDALVYLPALLMFAYTWQGSRSRRTQVCPLDSL